MRRDCFHAILKAALSHRLGVDCGSPRPPGQPLPPDEREALLRRLGELGLDKVS